MPISASKESDKQNQKRKHQVIEKGAQFPSVLVDFGEHTLPSTNLYKLKVNVSPRFLLQSRTKPTRKQVAPKQLNNEPQMNFEENIYSSIPFPFQNQDAHDKIILFDKPEESENISHDVKQSIRHSIDDIMLS